MAKRQGQAQEAFEAGQRNVVPGQAWVEALARGLQRELFGADMGTPTGQRLREELGSLGYEDALRQGYPEDYAMGRAAGSDWVDPLTLLAMRGTPLRGAGPRLAGPQSRPMLSGPGAIEGEVMAPRMAIEAGPHIGGTPPRAFAGPVNDFERNAVSASQIGRRGYGMGYREPSYWEEGGQGFRPSIDDFVEQNVVRNPEGYFDPTAVEQASSLVRQGRAREAMHPIYGANADRPNYGYVPEGAKGWADRPNPGVAPRYRGIPGREPFAGEIGEGPGYFGELPRPGIRSDVRQEIGQGAGAPRLRYEPVQGGRGMVTTQGGAQNLPVMAQGRGMVPTMLEGEFSEVPGIGYAAGGKAGPQPGVGYIPPRSAAPDIDWSRMGEAPGSRLDFGVDWGGPGRVAAGRGIPPGAMRAGLIGSGLGLAAFPHSQEELGALPGWNPRLAPVSPYFDRQGFKEMYPLGSLPANPLEAGQPQPEARPVAPKRKAAKVPQQSAKAKRETPLPPRHPQEAPQQGGWEPNINYLVTQALDRLLGQDQAETGRRQQQEVEAYEKKYGLINY